MKKILTLLCTSLIVFLMFGGPGNVAMAHEGDGCDCVTKEITGAEKNKIVSNLLKSDDLKNARKEIKEEGFKWNGIGNVEVIYNITHDIMMVGIPVKNADETIWTAVFFNGVYMGVAPPETIL
ncbi:hypothetical protein [Neobacillus niacini]|uniref:hypothetical protein n=1 Tax=Neobacillus niacini TaxID=86668 RepID=UPI0005EFF0B9|nr:hypothetical protein [Neobacillus niacini]